MAKQDKIDALKTQAIFSVLTVATSAPFLGSVRASR